MATRVASGKAIEALGPRFAGDDGRLGRSGPSTHTHIDGAGNFEPENCRDATCTSAFERMPWAPILNGMALHRGLIPYGEHSLSSPTICATDAPGGYDALPVIYVFTHDSIGMGEDGPTHQPVEQLLGLRSIPGMVVLRPGGCERNSGAWRLAIGRKKGPVALVLTRQGSGARLGFLPSIPEGVPLALYPCGFSGGDRPEIILIATGSEVHLALEVANGWRPRTCRREL